MLVYSFASAAYFVVVYATTGALFGAGLIAGVCILAGISAAILCRKGVGE